MNPARRRARDQEEAARLLSGAATLTVYGIIAAGIGFAAAHPGHLAAVLTMLHTMVAMTVVHEAGHYLAAHALGYDARFHLGPRSAYNPAVMYRGRNAWGHDARDHIVIGLAGPTAGCAFSVMLAAGAPFFAHAPWLAFTPLAALLLATSDLNAVAAHYSRALRVRLGMRALHSA